MARRLQVNVQMDRLPDVIAGPKAGWRQFGMSLSAAIEPDGADGAAEVDRDLVLPWWWDGAAGGAWDPHNAESWRIWRVLDTGEVQRLDAWEMASKAPTDFDTVVPSAGPAPAHGRFRTRLEAEVDSFLAALGPRALETPRPGAPVSRTVFGLVESLTSLPAPVPAGLKVWAAVQTNAVIDPEARYVAVPVFATTAGDRYQTWDSTHPDDGGAGALRPTRFAEGRWRFDYPIETAAREGWADLRPSLPMTVMQIGADDPQRLIDLSSLLVRKGSGPAVEGVDWSSDLVARIAETIDPALRAAQVLEAVLAGVAGTDPDGLDAPDPRRAALKADLAAGGADHFRTALATLHQSVLAHRARGSRAAPAPALGFLEGLALRDPSLWSRVASLMLAHAGAETHANPPRAPDIVPISRRRLAEAAGLDPRIDLGEESLHEPSDLASADALQTWLVSHWTQTPTAQPAPDGDGRRVYYQSLDRLVASDGAVTRRVDPLGLLDLARLRGANPQELELGFAIGGTLGAAEAQSVLIRLVAPYADATAPRIEVRLDADAAGVRLTMPGQAPASTALQFRPGELLLRITASPVGDFQAEVRFEAELGAQHISLAMGPFDVAAAAAAGRLGLETISPPNASVGLKGQGDLPASAVEEQAKGRPWRTHVALAYYGAEASGLIAGWLEGQPVNAAWMLLDLRDTLIAAVTAYVGPAFDDAFNAAAPAAMNTDLRQLLDVVCAAAKSDAIQLAGRLVPRARDDLDLRAQEASPLSFTIDQLQDFEEDEDLWARLAGLGLLIRRTDAHSDVTDDEWWSLNRATLHVTAVSEQGVRDPLGPVNAVAVRGASQWDARWIENSRVDPAALVVAEVNGARAAVVRYESRPVVAELQGALKLENRGGRFIARRPEAYYFPTRGQGAMRLPPLTFGRTYQVAPYLIGHGGTMPPALREVAEDPTSGPPIWDPAVSSVRVARSGLQGCIREAKYWRITPISAPALVKAETVWPRAPEGVEALHKDLPLRLPPVTVPAGTPARFFDATPDGTLTSPPAGSGAVAGATIRFAALAAPSGARLRLRVVGADRVLLDAEVDAPEAGGLELEIIGAEVAVYPLSWPATAVAEDEPERSAELAVTLAGAVVPVAEWRRVALEVSVTGGDAQLEPPLVWWGAREGRTWVRVGDAPQAPDDARPPLEEPGLLDGIAWGAALARRARLRVSRPTTTAANFDRWLNGPTGGFGAATADAIRQVLAAAERISADPSAREALPDPAVEALVLEVIRLYPTRGTELAPTVVGYWRGLPKPFLPESSAHTLAVVVDPTVDNTTPARWRNGELTVSPGCIYELRLYGAAPMVQPDYAPASVTVRQRFSRAAAASLREVRIGTDTWLFGTPRVLSLEVATDLMPRFTRERPPFRISLPAQPLADPEALTPVAPLSEPIRPAVVRLAPDWIDRGAGKTARYAALRSVSETHLVEQPWDWRGLPHPVLESGATGFGEDHDLSNQVREYVDAAYLWRDDLDRLRETRAPLTRAQVYGGRMTWDPSRSDAVQLLRRELPHREGARLWRFGLRATSRYAALRPGDQRLRVAWHRPPEGAAKWWQLVARDRLEPRGARRTPKRPGLMLVLPLTEPMMGPGAVPPLLALFNDTLFPEGNAADGLEAVVEVARHPLTATEMMDPSHATGFDAAMQAVVAGRRAVTAASRALAAARDLEAPANPAEQVQAKANLTGAEAQLAAAETAFAAIYATGAAWGIVRRWLEIQGETQALWQNAFNKWSAETDPAVKQALKHDLDRLDARRTVVAGRLAQAQAVAASPPPAPYAGRIPDVAAKYLQEWAPDPIRTKDAAIGDPLALRLDGPVGYTLDIQGQAGSYPHAGLLVSPVAGYLRPWSLVKLRFRRLEAPELLDVAEDVLDATWSERALDTAWAFHAPDLEGELVAKFTFELGDTQDAYLHLRAEKSAGSLTISLSTPLGYLRTWSTPAPDDRKVEVRAVVSERPRPQGEKYAPSADVSVQVRITSPATDGLRRDSEGVWLSVACLPLTSVTPLEPTDTPKLRAHMSQARQVRSRRVRASDFTPGVWCQFATAMSLVEVRGTVGSGTDTREVAATLPVEDLVVMPTPDGASLQLGVVKGSRSAPRLMNQTLATLGLTAVGAPDLDSQLEERLYVVATRYVYDAVDRLRERPVAIFELPSTPAAPVLGKPSWSYGEATPFASGGGRIRLLHVLRGKERMAGGFESSPRAFPMHFFGPGSEGDPEWPDDPPDAAGQVLGVSRPIEWHA